MYQKSQVVPPLRNTSSYSPDIHAAIQTGKIVLISGLNKVHRLPAQLLELA